MTCALLTCADPYFARIAEDYARLLFDVKVVKSYPRHGRHEVPTEAWGVDWLFSFLSPAIVPESVLQTIKRSAINFHPAPPEYPGVGSASYAIYDQIPVFGVTSHVMIREVDAGKILRVMRFPILAVDTCYTLWERARHYALSLYFETLAEIARSGFPHQVSGETWSRRAYTRVEFEEWMEAPADDEERKARALEHPAFPRSRRELCSASQ